MRYMPMKKIQVEVPENTRYILNGDEVEKCFNAVILNYKKSGDYSSASCIQQLMTALFNVPEVYLYKDD